MSLGLFSAASDYDYQESRGDPVPRQQYSRGRRRRRGQVFTPHGAMALDGVLSPMTRHDRLRQYDTALARLQHLWAYLLKRKMRIYRQ